MAPARSLRRPGPALAVLAGLLGIPPLGAEAAVPRVRPEVLPGTPQGAVAMVPSAALLEEAAARPLAALAPARDAAGRDLAALAAWNREGKLPVRNGLVRTLPERRTVRLLPGAPAGVQVEGETAAGVVRSAPSGSLLWAGAVRVAGAFRLRAHLAGVALPAGTRMWVAGEDGERFGPFGLDLLGPDRGLWTPSTGGETLVLEIELPPVAVAAADAAAGPATPDGGEGYGFDLDRIVEIVGPADPEVAGPGDQSCFRDGSCVTPAELPAVALLRRAVAHLEFVDRRGSFVCSGGLLADADPATAIPYLLTAYHCFPFEESARSVEAFWDYARPGCGGPAPALASLPRSAGAVLLANGSRGDFALLRLAAIPAGRALLGWDATPVADGTVLHRLSHPRDPTGLALPQVYAKTEVSSATSVCAGAERGPQIYSRQLSGGVFGGSSGAPAVTAAGLAVGQLSGGCGPNAAIDGCDPTTAIRDGAFATSYPTLARFLDPGATAVPAGPCVPGPQTLCLGAGGRFRVEVVWRTRAGASGVGSVVPLAAADSGLFWFFGSANWEMLVKVLDGCLANRHFWVYAAATTDVEYRLTVTDTRTGQVARYSNPLGQASPAIADTRALRCP